MSEHYELTLSDNLAMNIERDKGGVQFSMGPYVRHGDEPCLVGTMDRDRVVFLIEYLNRLIDAPDTE